MSSFFGLSFVIKWQVGYSEVILIYSISRSCADNIITKNYHLVSPQRDDGAFEENKNGTEMGFNKNSRHYFSTTSQPFSSHSNYFGLILNP